MLSLGKILVRLFTLHQIKHHAPPISKLQAPNDRNFSKILKLRTKIPLQN